MHLHYLKSTPTKKRDLKFRTTFEIYFIKIEDGSDPIFVHFLIEVDFRLRKFRTMEKFPVFKMKPIIPLNSEVSQAPIPNDPYNLYNLINTTSSNHSKHIYSMNSLVELFFGNPIKRVANGWYDVYQHYEDYWRFRLRNPGQSYRRYLKFRRRGQQNNSHIQSRQDEKISELEYQDPIDETKDEETLHYY